jgi:hypothetical protein
MGVIRVEPYPASAETVERRDLSSRNGGVRTAGLLRSRTHVKA